MILNRLPQLSTCRQGSVPDVGKSEKVEPPLQVAPGFCSHCSGGYWGAGGVEASRIEPQERFGS